MCAGNTSTPSRHMQNTAHRSANERHARGIMNSKDSDRKWAETAISRELGMIARCGEENAHKPDSEWWKSVFRIASVLKGAGRRSIAPERVRVALHRVTPQWVKFKPSREKGIDYLFGRAMNKANQRFRVTMPTPPYTEREKANAPLSNRGVHQNSVQW